MPVYEEQEALRYANYNWTQWKRLPWREKALAVAHHRYHRLVEIHVSDAVNAKTEQEQKRQAAKTKSRRG